MAKIICIVYVVYVAIFAAISLQRDRLPASRATHMVKMNLNESVKYRCFTEAVVDTRTARRVAFLVYRR